MEATRPEKKPARKPNFSQAEIIAMLEEIRGRKEVILSRLQNNLTHRMKAEAWRKVTEAVNARGVAMRSVADVKKKWKGVKSDTTQAVRNQKKTGGGPEEKPAIYAELVFAIIGEHSEGVHGIDGRSQTQSCIRIRSKIYHCAIL